MSAISETYKDLDERMMAVALQYAQQAADIGEVPVGAVLVDKQGTIVAGSGNNCISANDPTGHAEMHTLRLAAEKTGNYRFPGSCLYVTLEPCAMCAGALVNARIERVIYGASDPKGGAINSIYSIGVDGKLNHTFNVTPGVLQQQCSAVLKAFFKIRR